MPTTPQPMEPENYVIQASTAFSKSLLWDLNREYYQEKGTTAWSADLVPFNVTSSSKCAKTYADLIFALLQDLAVKGQLDETVYFLELGVGNARLAFQILHHLEKNTSTTAQTLPPYCYVLSDIIEDNLSYFQTHPQLQKYYENGTMDLTYFDAVASDELFLRKQQQTIVPSQLDQPIVVIANYIFDSIPNDLIHIVITKYQIVLLL